MRDLFLIVRKLCSRSLSTLSPILNKFSREDSLKITVVHGQSVDWLRPSRQPSELANFRLSRSTSRKILSFFFWGRGGGGRGTHRGTPRGRNNAARFADDGCKAAEARDTEAAQSFDWDTANRVSREKYVLQPDFCRRQVGGISAPRSAVKTSPAKKYIVGLHTAGRHDRRLLDGVVARIFFGRRRRRRRRRFRFLARFTSEEPVSPIFDESRGSFWFSARRKYPSCEPHADRRRPEFADITFYSSPSLVYNSGDSLSRKNAYDLGLRPMAEAFCDTEITDERININTRCWRLSPSVFLI